METIERIIAAPAETVWELWTTPQGIGRWWAPDGFRTDVSALDLQPGGELVYTMTATAPEQVAFMQGAGLPLSTTSNKTFTEVEPVRRLAYSTLADFIPGVEPYEFRTEVELRPADDGGTQVIMTADAMHDEEWTGRLAAGRANEMDNLAAVVKG